MTKKTLRYGYSPYMREEEAKKQDRWLTIVVVSCLATLIMIDLIVENILT